jgi:voltage-gated potassium channel
VTTWERRMEWPLTIAAVVFLGVYAWPILDPRVPTGLERACTVVGWAVWGLFAVDYVARVAGAPRRVSWILRHPLELVVLVLPMLRPLRVLRLVALLRVLNRTAAGSLRGRVAIYVSAGTSLIAFVAALAVLEAERGSADASITTFGDAMWWACTTMTTVGYGDLYPVTTAGRFVGVGLMIGGLALLGTVAATFASWLVEAVREENDETENQLDAVQAELVAIHERLDRVLDRTLGDR